MKPATWTIEAVHRVKVKGEERDVYSVFKSRGGRKVRLGYTADSIDDMLMHLQQLLRPGDVVEEPSGTYTVGSGTSTFVKKGN